MTSISSTSSVSSTSKGQSNLGTETLVFSAGGCSFGSIVALEWAGIPFHVVRFDILNPETPENFLKVSPIMKQTPQLIRSDGRPLAESGAILQRIARLAPEKHLWLSLPEDDVDEFNFVLTFMTSGFFTSWLPVFQAYRFATPGSESYNFLREAGTKSVTKALTQIEKMLEGKEWFVGGRKTIIDAYFVGLYRWNDRVKLFDDIEIKFPLSHKHFLKLEQDEGVKFAHAIEDQTEAQSTGQFKGVLAWEDLKI